MSGCALVASLSLMLAPELPPLILGPHNVDGLAIDLDIHHGQDGIELPEDQEETIGGFTAANINDTDANGEVDAGQQAVTNEVDLMKMIIRKPTKDVGHGTKLKLKRLEGSARVWESASKGTEVVMDKEYEYGELPKTVWVEAMAPSSSLRDMVFEIEYAGLTDKVKATGVWAELEAIAHERMTLDALKANAPWNDFTNPPETTFRSVTGGGHLGLVPVTPDDRQSGRILNAIAFQFRVIPPGVGRNESQTIVKFDNTRQVTLKTWRQAIATNDILQMQNPKTITHPGDLANDDSAGDGSDLPTALDHFFCVDTPGYTRIAGGIAPEGYRYYYKFNAYEFLRIRVDGTRPGGDVVSGSRASAKHPWHVAHQLGADADFNFFRTTGDTTESAGTNDIGPGHTTLP